MTQSYERVKGRTRRHRLLIGGLTISAIVMTFASEAKAACVAKDDNSRVSTGSARTRVMVQPPSVAGVTASLESYASIVGLWNVTFLVGNGPDVFDQGFQHWHVDNTELMVDNAVAPSFGNVCIGVWKQVAARTYKLKHTTFNWDAEGRPAGTFVLTMTVRLDRRGHAYAGEYEADSFDLAGNVIPELHAEGVVRGVRITVH